MADADSAPSGSYAQRALACFRTGLVKGLRTALWLLAIMVPVSLAVTLLHWTGVLGWVAQWIEPVLRLAGLPGEAALPFLTGALLTLYSAIAAMAPLDLTHRQITILALMLLISHNLPVEVSVQRRAGSSWWRILALRLAMTFTAAVLLNLVLPVGDAPGGAQTGQAAAALKPLPADLVGVLKGWMADSARLIGKITLIVIGLMVLQSFLKEFGAMRPLARLLQPLLWLLGLPRSTAFLWIVANTLGLAFGAAVIFEEVESGALSKREVELLNRSIAVCHSLLEDTLLLVAVGAWAFWITAPRLALAAAAVWLYRLTRHVPPAQVAP